MLRARRDDNGEADGDRGGAARRFGVQEEAGRGDGGAGGQRAGGAGSGDAPGRDGRSVPAADRRRRQAAERRIPRAQAEEVRRRARGVRAGDAGGAGLLAGALSSGARDGARRQVRRRAGRVGGRAGARLRRVRRPAGQAEGPGAAARLAGVGEGAEGGSGLQGGVRQGPGARLLLRRPRARRRAAQVERRQPGDAGRAPGGVPLRSAGAEVPPPDRDRRARLRHRGGARSQDALLSRRAQAVEGGSGSSIPRSAIST